MWWLMGMMGTDLNKRLYFITIFVICPEREIQQCDWFLNSLGLDIPDSEFYKQNDEGQFYKNKILRYLARTE